MDSLYKTHKKEVIKKLKEITKDAEKGADKLKKEHLKTTGKELEAEFVLAYKLGHITSGINNVIALLEN